jgi:hypothetical protein
LLKKITGQCMQNRCRLLQLDHSFLFISFKTSFYNFGCVTPICSISTCPCPCTGPYWWHIYRRKLSFTIFDCYTSSKI